MTNLLSNIIQISLIMLLKGLRTEGFQGKDDAVASLKNNKKIIHMTKQKNSSLKF